MSINEADHILKIAGDLPGPVRAVERVVEAMASFLDGLGAYRLTGSVGENQ